VGCHFPDHLLNDMAIIQAGITWTEFDVKVTGDHVDFHGAIGRSGKRPLI
jgi:hypothetical protein